MGEEVQIKFLETGMEIIQLNDHFNFSIDTVLLSSFATINAKTKKVLELGSGNGALLLLLSKRTTAKLYGLEILETSHKLAEKNIELNKIEDKIELINGDLRENEKYFQQQEFDLVLSNPPFFRFDEEKSMIKQNENLSSARHEMNAGLEEIIVAGKRLLKSRGHLAVVHRAERLSDILETMRRHEIEPKRVLFCYSKKKSDAKVVLVEGKKDGEEGVKILPPLYIHGENGGYSEVVRKMFRGEIVDFYE